MRSTNTATFLRDQPQLRTRRDSRAAQNMYGTPNRSRNSPTIKSTNQRESSEHRRHTYTQAHDSSRENSGDEGEIHDKTPLLASNKSVGDQHQAYGLFGTSYRPTRPARRESTSTASSHKKRKPIG